MHTGEVVNKKYLHLSTSCCSILKDCATVANGECAYEPKGSSMLINTQDPPLTLTDWWTFPAFPRHRVRKRVVDEKDFNQSLQLITFLE